MCGFILYCVDKTENISLSSHVTSNLVIFSTPLSKKDKCVERVVCSRLKKRQLNYTPTVYMFSVLRRICFNEKQLSKFFYP